MNLVCKIRGHRYDRKDTIGLDNQRAWIFICKRCLHSETKTQLELEVESAQKQKLGKVVYIPEPTAEEEWERDHPLKRVFGKVWRKPKDE